MFQQGVNEEMIIYKFFDTDCTGREEYDISGEEYKELITTCCKYCEIMSLRFLSPQTSFINELDQFVTSEIKNITFIYEHYYRNIKPENQPDVKYYRVCPELCELLLKIADSIFKWIYGWGYTNPEDPVFYRADGSVFFSSVIHDGECALTPRSTEDVSNIISKDHWILFE